MILFTNWPFNLTDNQAAVIVPTFASILVFALGFFIRWIYRLFQKRKSIISFREMVFEWSALISNVVQAQIQSLKELSDQLNKTGSLYPESFSFVRSLANKLNELTVERVVSVFIDNCHFRKEDKRSKYSFNLVSQYDFLASIEPIIHDKYNAYNSQANALREQWNNLLIELQHEIDSVSPSSMEDSMVNKRILLVIDSYMSKRVHEDLIGEFYSRLITPLNETVEFCKANYPEVRCYQNVYECVNRMMVLYNSWHTLTRGYADVFKTYASLIEKSHDSLQEAIRYFKDYTRVKCFAR